MDVFDSQSSGASSDGLHDRSVVIVSTESKREQRKAERAD